MRLLPRFSAVVALLAAVTCVPAAEPKLPDDWAFHSFQRPAVPAIRYPQTATRNDIDRFLLAKLQKKGLSFAPEADRRTLIRRVTFDLIGLPPSPEEVEAFVTSKDADAYEKLVDKLLASPQFGERQALLWLDLVRFAETDGFNADGLRPHAWRYRDYVIKSFNTDKPFNRFIKEQIAGDELYPGDKDALIATGFLRHFPDEYNAVNLEQRRYEIITDITDTTAAAFLGLTAGCARCHDHKYDPVSQVDYFRLQAFFAGYWPVEAPLSSPAERAEYAKQLAVWEAKTATIRAAMDVLERPGRKRLQDRERARFPKEYADLIDLPFEKRSSLEKQLAVMVASQVYGRGDGSKSLKGAQKTKYTALKAELVKFAKEKPPELPVAMAMADLPEPPPTMLFKRGNWRKPSDELVPGFIRVITDRDANAKPIHGSPGRRAALANWIASKENPLTARVIVNRLWQHHFGYGIVRTSSDFGVAGERPTHPALLNWLASELMSARAGWSLKHIHRLIVTSTAYRQGACGKASGAKVDPDNKLLWHFPPHRLEGEALRDAMLAVSGQLNLKAGGPSVFPELPVEQKTGAWKLSTDPVERNRRSVYVFVKRNLRYPLFALFDATDRNETCARRFATTTAPQALTLLNDKVVLGFARAFANRLTKEVGTDRSQLIDRAFALAFSRPPTVEEKATAIGFLKRHKGTSDEALLDFCHALLNVNEFLFVD